MMELPTFKRGLGSDLTRVDWGDSTKPEETLVLVAEGIPPGLMTKVLIARKSEYRDFPQLDAIYPFSYGGAWFDPVDQFKSIQNLIDSWADELGVEDIAAVMRYMAWLTQYRMAEVYLAHIAGKKH